MTSRLFLFCLASWLIASGAGCAQSSDEPAVINGQLVVNGFGTHTFRALLDEKGVAPASPADVGENCRNSMIILLGPESIDTMMPWALSAVDRGATLLIASDQPVDLPHLGWSILNDTVTAAPGDCYLEKKQYPFIRPIKSILGFGKDAGRSIFEPFANNGPNAIAAMRSSALVKSSRAPLYDPHTLAGFPESAKLSRHTFDPARHHFAVGGKYGRGRVILLADHSVFIDAMMARDNNANASFASNLIDWLRGSEQKTMCLFLEDGLWKNKFALPPLPVNNDWMEWILKGLFVFEKHGDQILNRVDAAEPIDRAILSRYSRRQINRALLIGISALCLLALGYLLTRQRTTPDPARALVTPDLAALIPQGSALRQRFDSLIEADNASSVARELARDAFAGLNAEPEVGGAMPRFVAATLDGDHLRDRVGRLWKIAFGDAPPPTRPADLPGLRRELEQVLTAADNGWWKFESVQQAEASAPTQRPT